jgi:hypothetical protein
MKSSTYNKAKSTTATALVLILAFSVLLTVLVQAQDEGPHGGGGVQVPSDWTTGNYAAEQSVSGSLPSGVTPDITVTGTKAYLSFRPNPVGVGQSILVNMWINPALPTHRFNKDYKITITDPSGNEDVVTINSYCADTTSWFEYTVDQVGDWYLKFDFPGEYFPAGNYLLGWIVTNSSGSDYGSAYYEPASTEEQLLVVQEEQVLSWPPSAIPTDYWTYPVAVEHREWWPIMGDWPGAGYIGGGPVWESMYPDTNTRYGTSESASMNRFVPWVEGPESSHVVWYRHSADGGIIGGSAGFAARAIYAGGPSVVYHGRAYQSMTVELDGMPTDVAACYDVRTGEMYYAIPEDEGGVTPEFVTYLTPTAGRYGLLADRDWEVELITLADTSLYKIDPMTGEVDQYSLDLTSQQVSRTCFYDAYEGYCLTVQNLGYDEASGNYTNNRLVKWTTRLDTNNFADRILSNTSYARDRLPTAMDFESGLGYTSGEYMPYGMHARYGNEFWIIDIFSGETKHHIITSHPDTKYSTSGSGPIDHGKAVFMTQRGYPIAFDVNTGNVAWRGSPIMEYPWGEASFGAYDRSSAYGMYYWATYDGIYAWDWDTGQIVWNTKAPAKAHYESPYITDGVELNPFRSTVWVADGKVYSSNIEHTETNPLTRGWGTYCMDAFDGDLQWEIMFAGNIRAIAEGYLFLDESRSGTMWTIGKGESATTVTAPDMAVPSGTAMTIKGTVLDMSPAQPGTPCVSKDSMTTQMSYLHKQLPIDGIWHNETITGVPVTLTAIHDDGTVYDLGTTTTSGYYGSFGKAWTPEKEGTYEIIANFASDESYGSSAASTFVTVGPAPSGEEPPTSEEPAHPIISTEAAIIIGVVVIAAIAIIAYLVMRRPKK